MKVYLFQEGNAKMKILLGGKGAGLAEMTNLGLPVPPGVTITTEACKDYHKRGRKLPRDLEKEILEKLKIVEGKAGRRLGDPSNPLLVSVRSGAPVSMPGMMDTILNLGLNEATVEGLAQQVGDERFPYDCYRRLIQMFGKIVLEIEPKKFEEIFEGRKKKIGAKNDLDLKTEDLKHIASQFKALVKKETGKPFPEDVHDQLFAAVGAVFESWHNPRANTYRKLYKISEDLGTAVNIQTMVFGNMGGASGTGVLFTRNPSNGEKGLFGEFLSNAQGEDVVAGIRTPRHIDELKGENPKLYKELTTVAKTLETHYLDMQDVEFTVEKGRLFMLQTRTGKRTAQAAVKIAVDMVEEKLITVEEALSRVEPSQIDQLLHPHLDPSAKAQSIAKGLPASPGAASGRVVFDTDEAAHLGAKGEKVVLVRAETSPEDVHGMAVSQGVLTSRGGMTCHAAVVARGMGKACIVGCEGLDIDLEKETFKAGGVLVGKGDLITIDGTSGQVFQGVIPLIEPELTKELKILLRWADGVRHLKVRTNADTPEMAAKARELGAEGIGLCRTERMFNAEDRLPIVQEMILAETSEERKKALGKLLPLQKGDFIGIFKAMRGLPVTIRLLDLPLHEFLPQLQDLLVEVTTLRLKGGDKETLGEKERVLRAVQTLYEHNPMLGHRGCRLSVKYPEIYEMQTRAIFEAATELKKEGVGVELEIMLPLIGEANELRLLKEGIEGVAEEVMARAKVKADYSIGTMIEIPRAALTADQIAEHAEFFSFGTNDLTQTTFGYSRDDAEAKFLSDYLEKKILKANPFEILDQTGVGKLMAMAVEAGRKVRPNLKVGICGEHGGEPSSVEFCHRLNLDYVSCSPYRVPIARLAAAQAKLREGEGKTLSGWESTV